MIRVTGLDRLTKKLRKLQGTMADATITDALWDAAEPIEMMAADLAPTGLTGNLSRGVHRDVMDEELDPSVGVGIGTDVFYGLFSEVGTSHEPARPWLRPALDRNRRIAVASFAARVRSELKRAVR